MRYSGSHLAAVLLATLVCIEAVVYLQLHINYADLNAAYEEEKGELSSLQSLYDELDAEYRSLNTSYESLEESHNGLQHQYAVLQQSYADLLEEHDLETALRIGNGLESYFDYLREERVPAVWPSYQRKADFGAKLAVHSLGVDCWPSVEDAYYQIARKHSYESARERIDYVTDAINVATYDSSTEKIEKILDFISNCISYEDEINEVLLAPAETLAFRSGDCDDFSTLAACLFEALEIDAAFGIFKNSDNKYHCMVLVHLDELDGYDCWSLSDLTRYGLDEGKWMVIEPQYPIGNQDLEWIGEWNLVVATPLDANR